MKNNVRAELEVSTQDGKGKITSAFFPKGTEHLARALVGLLCEAAQGNHTFRDESRLVFTYSRRHHTQRDGRHAYSAFTTVITRLRDGTLYERTSTIITAKFKYTHFQRG